MMYNTFNSRIYTTPITITNLLTQNPYMVAHTLYVDVPTGVAMSLASIQQRLLCCAASYNGARDVLADIKQGNTDTGSLRTVEVLYAALRGLGERIADVRSLVHTLMLDAAIDKDLITSEKTFYATLNYITNIIEACNIMSHGRFVMQLDPAVSTDIYMLDRYLDTVDEEQQLELCTQEEDCDF